MRISELCALFDDCEMGRDCEFESLYLLGKTVTDDMPVTFVADSKYITKLVKSNAAAVICTDIVYDEIKDVFDGGICITQEPKNIFFKLHNYLYNNTSWYGDRFDTIIGNNSEISSKAIISDHNVVIGNNVIIKDNAIINENTTIGDNVIVRENAVIGTASFYYYGSGDNRTLVESAGGVVINDNVDIHNFVAIQRGVIGGNTIIGRNTKIDLNCAIGHNAIVGNNCLLTDSTMIGAGNIVGDNVFFGLRTTTAPNIKIGSNCKTAVCSVIAINVPDNRQVINYDLLHNKYIKMD